MTIVASTKRNPAAVNGVIGPSVVNLTSVVLAFNPFPISPEQAMKYRLLSPRVTYVIGVLGPSVDILEGDILTVSGVDYIVRSIGQWSEPPINYTKIYIEKQK